MAYASQTEKATDSELEATVESLREMRRNHNEREAARIKKLGADERKKMIEDYPLLVEELRKAQRLIWELKGRIEDAQERLKGDEWDD